ncbi:hypothetical protein K438DRAFT_1998424 [Mycena galopus ATCC 62051]|nr:hypothetical protein K438DRAFT_1998424 [Mycena galopus ATCC 62051]
MADADYSVSALIHVDTEHVPWLRPPAISGVRTAAWVTFRQSYKDEEEEEVVYMRDVGKNSKEQRVAQGEIKGYDHHLHRCLIFDETPPLDTFTGLTTGPEYSRPVPDWPFLYKSDERYLEWKKIASPSSKDCLPRINGGKFLWHAGAWAWGDDNESGEERVSLGPSEGEPLRTPTAPPVFSVAPVPERRNSVYDESSP